MRILKLNQWKNKIQGLGGREESRKDPCTHSQHAFPALYVPDRALSTRGKWTFRFFEFWAGQFVDLMRAIPSSNV